MTREEIENIPKNINTLFDLRQKLDEKLNKVCELAIKTLEQEVILDKIRTEIKCMEYIEGSVNNSDEYEAAKEDALEIIDKYKQTEPTTDIALERYKDLQDYFANAYISKSILENREEFKAWLERLRWNTKKVDELARKLEALERESKTGRWIKLDVGYGCSECSLATNEYGKNDYKYCPNCGAKMEVEHETD